jgi:hypothetical protein
MSEIDEAELLGAGRSGAVADAAMDGGKRVVPAALLRRCCHELKDQIDPRGLRLINAVVVGCLDLAGLAVPFPLRFDGCEFDSPVVVEGAELFELSLTGCPRLPGLLGNGLRLRRDLDLSRSHIAGAHWTNASTKRSAVWLCESDIGGRLVCAGTVIDGQGGRSIQADRIHVGGAVRLVHQFQARGEVRLLGARIRGSLDLDGAQFESVGAEAIDLADMIVEGNMFLVDDPAGNRPVVRGRIYMGSARIAGRLVICNAILQAPESVPTDSGQAKPGSGGVAVCAPRLSVGGEVTLAEHCEVTGMIDMSMGDMSSLYIGENCVLRAPGRTALDLTNAEIRSLVRMDKNAAVEGTVKLAGALLHGTLALHGQMSQPEDLSLVGGSGITVDGDVYLDDLRTKGGAVTFRSAKLGSLSAARAQLHNPLGSSIRLSQAVVKGPVRLIDGFSSTGLVALNRTTIEGRLHFTGGSFTCPAPSLRNKHGHAIEAISATVHGSIDLGWKMVSPSVDFTDATTTFLADDPATWPERFTIGGLTYDRFERPQGAPPGPVWDQAARCAWLSRQTEFDSGPYEQAARVFRQHGYTTEAEQILIAQRGQARRVGRSRAAWPRRATDASYAIIGYGYRPARVLWLLFALLVVVTISLEVPAAQATLRATNGNGAVYTTSGPLVPSAGTPAPSPRTRASKTGGDSCGNGEVPCFSPVWYAIDTVVPLISLDQRSTWHPDLHVRGGELMLWWLNLATLFGWLLSSIFALSLARLSRSP